MKSITQSSPTKALLLLATGVGLGIGAALVISMLVQHNARALADQNNSESTNDSTLAPFSGDFTHANNPEVAEMKDLKGVIKQIDVLKEYEHSFDRVAKLYTIVSRLDSHTLSELLANSIDLQWNLSRQIRTELQTVLIERLAITSPQEAIEFVLSLEDGKHDSATSFISIIVDAAKSDSESTKNGSIPLNEANRTLAVRWIAKNYVRLPYKKQQELFTKLDPETRFLKRYLESLYEASVGVPDTTGSAEIDNAQDAFSYVAQTIDMMKQWYHNRAVAVLEQMRTTMSNDETEEVLTAVALQHIASKNPTLAFEYAFAQLPRETRSFAVNEVIREWATKEPSAALTAVNNLDASGLKAQLQSTAVCIWAGNEPEYVLANLSDFPRHAHIDGACNAIGSLAAVSPERAVAWTVQMKNDSMLFPAANTLVRIWSHIDLEAAHKWVLEEPAIANIRAELYEPLASAMVATDPTRALELARKHPLATGQVGFEASILREIAFKDIQVALELLPNVRASQKNFAYGAVGSVHVQNRDFQKAINLGLELGESAHANYYQYISYIWVNTDPRKLYKMLPELPNEEARSKAAYALCVLNDNNDYLTKEQVGILDQYLTATDRETLGPLAPSNKP